MCGIAGYAGRNPPDAATLRRMCDAIVHRGPDQDGYLVAGNVALGMRRLSIIGVESGRQPIYNEDRTVAVVYNGEVYNFAQLRADLEGRGHRFGTATDTECIVHLYEEYGERCVEHLRGMFAFALWDEPQQRLLLARDRVGKKPLLYRATREGIWRRTPSPGATALRRSGATGAWGTSPSRSCRSPRRSKGCGN
jgi:asparagine synthase (glutamine-hydrolysing)